MLEVRRQRQQQQQEKQQQQQQQQQQPQQEKQSSQIQIPPLQSKTISIQENSSPQSTGSSSSSTCVGPTEHDQLLPNSKSPPLTPKDAAAVS